MAARSARQRAAETGLWDEASDSPWGLRARHSGQPWAEQWEPGLASPLWDAGSGLSWEPPCWLALQLASTSPAARLVSLQRRQCPSTSSFPCSPLESGRFESMLPQAPCTAPVHTSCRPICTARAAARPCPCRRTRLQYQQQNKPAAWLCPCSSHPHTEPDKGSRRRSGPRWP